MRQVGATALQHRFRSAGVDAITGDASVRAARPRSSGTVTRPGVAARAVLGGQHDARAERVSKRSTQKSSDAGAGAVEQRRADRPRAARSSLSVANGARPVPPATIQASAASGGARERLTERAEARERACPARRRRAARCRSPTRLLRIENPINAPSGARRPARTPSTGRRSSGVSPGGGPDHHELSRAGWPSASSGARNAITQ